MDLPEKMSSRSLSDLGSPGRVLVVDDEPTVRRFTSRILEEHGFSVQVATDGLEALEALQSDSFLDLVVSDIVMPRLNGIELYQTMSTMYPDIPVILMSGYGTDRLNELGIALPCGVLAKPFLPKILISEVRRCMRQRN